MIICYQGSPGSGKSYDAVNRVIENLKKGRVVYTNIDGLDDSLNREVVRVLTELDDYELSKRLIHLTSDQVGKFWQYTKSGSMVVIDEIHKWFNSRDWQSAKNREFADWASTHRHSGFDVVMVTQDIQKVDSQVRSVVEFTYEYRKLNMFGSWVNNKYICYAYMGGEVSGKPLGKLVKSYNQKIFAAYKSYVAGDIKELGIQSHFNILKHPVFYSIPIVLALFLYFFSKSSFIRGDFLGMNKKASISKVVAPELPQGKKVKVYERVISKESVGVKQKIKTLPVPSGPVLQGKYKSGEVSMVVIDNKKMTEEEAKSLYPRLNI